MRKKKMVYVLMTKDCSWFYRQSERRMEKGDEQVDSNLQREKILPSEKAFVYKMRLDAMKHQGKKIGLWTELNRIYCKRKIAN